jgi:Xaa-Pro aminopeptidase
MELKKRLNKIAFLKDKVDAILIAGWDPNFFYFTNSYSQETLCYDFSEPIIVATKMGADQAREGWIKKIKVIDAKKRKDFFKAITSMFDKGDVVGVNKNGFTASAFDKLKRNIHVKDIGKDLEEVRMIKTEYEIKCIKKACSIGIKAFNEVKDDIRVGITENEVAGLFELAVRKQNAKDGIIVAFGSNTRIPHHVPTGKKLKKTEPILLDFGVYHNGYVADITRMINSKLEGRLKNVMDALYPQIRLGIKASSLEQFARKALGKYDKYFTHSLGHGVGVAIHERPNISINSKDILKPGMVFTIEPGIYMRNEGARIEDVFLMTKNGKKKLT